MREKKIVTAIIADHLRIAGLMNALQDTGFITSSYYPQHGKTIMKIMGIKSTLGLMHYLALVDDCSKEKRSVDEDAEDLYNDLVWIRKETEKVF